MKTAIASRYWSSDIQVLYVADLPGHGLSGVLIGRAVSRALGVA